MYTLNITVKVNHEIAEEWLAWQINHQIPGIMETGCFTSFEIHRLLGHDDEEGITYILQFKAPSLEKYNEFIANFDSSFRRASVEKWADRFIDFRTVLEKIELSV